MSIEEKMSPYYLSYSILAISLKNADIKDGIVNALGFIKVFFNVSDVLLYKVDENDTYVDVFNQHSAKNNTPFISLVLNTASKLIENKKYYYMNYTVGNIKSFLFIPIIANGSKYSISLADDEKKINIDESYLKLFIEAMQIVLDKLELINCLKKDANIDILTGLNNRMSYEKRISEEPINNTIYILFDLFRLKTINDNYSHALGDEYIKQTAEILNRYFPKDYNYRDEHGRNYKVETGSCVYRIGGDEFALISTCESIQNVQMKLLLIQEEVKNINLNIDEPFRINYGLAVKTGVETFKDLNLIADNLMADDKNATYKALNLDRRR